MRNLRLEAGLPALRPCKPSDAIDRDGLSIPRSIASSQLVTRPPLISWQAMFANSFFFVF